MVNSRDVDDVIFNPLRKHLQQNFRAWLVGRQIECRRTGEVLDVRTAVFLQRNGEDEYAISQRGWAEMLTDGTADALAQRGLTPDPTSVKPPTTPTPKRHTISAQQTELFEVVADITVDIKEN